MPKSKAAATPSGPALIERLVKRCSTPDHFPVARGSSLAADDIASRPFPTSDVLRMTLTAGIDHLHAAKVLVIDQQVPHNAATWSLARGALENLATAYWILGPDRRDDRIEHTLRWHAQDIMDAATATGHLDVASTASADSRLAELDVVAHRRQLATDRVRRGYAITDVVAYAELCLPHPALGVRRPWQLSSGYAHGQPWVEGGAPALEAGTPSAPSGIQYPYLAAVQLLEAFLRLYEVRANTSLV